MTLKEVFTAINTFSKNPNSSDPFPTAENRLPKAEIKTPIKTTIAPMPVEIRAARNILAALAPSKRAFERNPEALAPDTVALAASTWAFRFATKSAL